jgi:antibiotic biosynthesis monooxygenase (ABM) superfamily enzyme
MTNPAPAEPASRIQPAPPSVHVRAVVTWIAIFPLVAIGLTALAPFSETWHPVLRAFVLTVLIVPLAVYLVVPRLLALYTRLRARR